MASVGSGERAEQKGPRTLAELQNQAKRDPEGYRSEFSQQWRHYESNLQIFLLKPSGDAHTFGELVTFIAHLGNLYPDIVQPFPEQIRRLLLEHYQILDPALRQTLCRALILLRGKEMLTSLVLLELFFQLFRCSDKALREMLFTYIVQDIKRINMKHKQNHTNKKLQNFMYAMLTDSNQIAAKKSLDVMVSLYRKNVWNDSKTANVISTALFSEVSKIKTTALRFFLGGDQEDDGSDDEQDPNAGKTYDEMLKNNTAKKTNRRKRLLKAQLQKEHKKERQKDKAEVFNFSALHLLNDPQSMSEKLFKQLKSGSKDRWEVQLTMMNFLSRVISIHELMILNFYPYLERYLWPHKQDVTQVLTYVAQACHETVPPEALESVLMKIANNFVSERSAPEVMAVGLNAIREICRRCPLAMTDTLLQDLAEYKKYKNKSVMTAAKGLIGTFRELNPSLLKKKDRGRPDGSGDTPRETLQYGEHRPAEMVAGVELLTMAEDYDMLPVLPANARAEDSDDGDWVTVHHDQDDDVAEKIADTRRQRKKNANNDTKDSGDDAASADEDEDADAWVTDDGESDEEHDDNAVHSVEEKEDVENRGEETEDAENRGEEKEDAENSDAEHSDAEHEDVEKSDEEIEGMENSAAISRRKKKFGNRKRKFQKDIAEDEGVTRDTLTAEERRARALERMRTRPLTQKDFDRIRILQLEKKLLPANSGSIAKAAADSAQRKDILNEEDILPAFKKQRQSKEERLASIMEGREGRGKFGIRKGHEGGTTNKTKEKRKNPQMLRQKQSVRLRKIMGLQEKMVRAKSKKKQFRGKMRK